MADILSVGIDVGTSTTQVIFSKLTVENTSAYFSVPKISITRKEVVYRGDIHFTPLDGPVLIDGVAVRRLVEEEFRKAGFSPADTGTGAVIVTGESALKENAAIVVENLSGFAGEFVVSTAGPDLEAILAGKGSGAQRYSADHNCVVANLDIGGGTTNVVLFKGGEVAATGCLDIGGRLIRLEEDGTVAYVSSKAHLVARSLGISLEKGKKTSVDELRMVTDKMAALLCQVMGFAPREDALLEGLRTPGSSPFALDSPPEYLCFSGGVAEAIYGGEQELFAYGDIGVLLGKSVADSPMVKRGRVIGGAETIRATVVGAGTYATSISGSTITITKDIFPVKNVPVLYIGPSREEVLESAPLLEERIRWFQEQSGRKDFVLGFRGEKNPSFTRIEALAETLSRAVNAAVPPEYPILVVLESDMAKALGQAVHRKLGDSRTIICIDGIQVTQGDYVDMGKPLMDGLVVPVVVKTLVFQ